MKPLRILIVDDDATISALLAEVLEGLGHSICGIEETADGAVSLALWARPDLMIVDENLRSGSGTAAIATIAQTIIIPHILMSGKRLPTGVGTGIALQKPFSYNGLLIAIDRATGEADASLAPAP